MRRIVLTLPCLLVSPNVALRQHWAERRDERKHLHDEVMVALGGTRHLPRPCFARARVTVWQHRVSLMDPDNLTAACKALLDVLQPRSDRHPLGISTGIIADDSAECCELVVRQIKEAHRSDQRTVVVIEELDAIVAEPAPDLFTSASGKRAAA